MAKTDKTPRRADYFNLSVPADVWQPLDDASDQLRIPKTQIIRLLVRHNLPQLVKKLEGEG